MDQNGVKVHFVGKLSALANRHHRCATGAKLWHSEFENLLKRIVLG